MSQNIPTFEPDQITIGETLIWKKSLADYSAADGWVLTYYFRGAGPGFDIAATADGSDFAITVPAASTAGMTAGAYQWQAWVVLAGVKHQVDSGTAKAVASFLTVDAATTVDGRSQLKKILDGIDAMILGKATADQQEYTIGNRQLKRIPIPDLIALRTQYAKLYSSERRADKLRQGAPFFKNINVRFVKPS